MVSAVVWRLLMGVSTSATIAAPFYALTQSKGSLSGVMQPALRYWQHLLSPPALSMSVRVMAIFMRSIPIPGDLHGAIVPARYAVPPHSQQTISMWGA